MIRVDYERMNSTISATPAMGEAKVPWKLAVTILLALLFAILFGWSARSIVTMQPVPVVPCKHCAEKCPCPRMAGAIRCGCLE